MSGLSNIYNELNRINKLPRVSVKELGDLRFKVVLDYQNIMESYFQFGEIQSNFKKVCEDNGYLVNTILGDGQDAIFVLSVDKSKL